MWKIWTDGGCRDNPGPGSWAFVINDLEGNVVHEQRGFLPYTTNNNAEYHAFASACLWLLKRWGELPPEIRFFSDSKLMVEQINLRWQVKSEELERIFREARDAFSTLEGHSSMSLEHVPRDKNKRADALCNEEMDERGIVCSKKGKRKAA